ncbi:hypothetical protein [Exiguobacterium sp. s191]|uniref:hypothetical protein n=1 Tax=Exiguobacterium sp. s191 TaxID=2751196 RepID=UPI001BEB9915|nr:hypothetical protein [Exiguobacterium sp. s191]
MEQAKGKKIPDKVTLIDAQFRFDRARDMVHRCQSIDRLYAETLYQTDLVRSVFLYQFI